MPTRTDNSERADLRRALALLEEFARAHRELTAEHVRLYASTRGAPSWMDARAWGPIMRRAAIGGILQKTARTVSATAPSSHRGRCAVWVSRVFVGEKELDVVK